ncbi:MAG: RuBisCO large subunit C-terminal-like domain-containing protein [Candidatus Nanoarchaeia archaeon]|nr:RuBisCO large subunit C-terminal-like domain-containing protein [Candidatus Nanoarchaeia archaeon]
MIDDYLFQPEADKKSHIIATYFLRSQNLLKAAKGVAIGQSIGNPDIRTGRDSAEIFRNNLAKILGTPYDFNGQTEGTVRIAYPLANLGEGDGITQLLCTLMGGQMDIDMIESCQLRDIQLPSDYLKQYQGPKFGMHEIKRRTRAVDRPLLGGIVKPKTGITVSQIEGLVEELLMGGVDFIKEDEILGNPKICPFYERVPKVVGLVRRYEDIQEREIFYTPCINADFPEFLRRAEFASSAGARAVHLNFHAGLGAYKTLRDADLETAIFFQKSGDKVLTSRNNTYSISWPVICKLARISGCDFIHAGMWGGYLSDSLEDLSATMNILRNGKDYPATIPALSCGSHPGLVDTTRYHFGDNLMMNVGGAMQGHPLGTEAGARAMRQAMAKPLKEDMFGYMQGKPELKAAIEEWGYVEPASGKMLYKK